MLEFLYPKIYVKNLEAVPYEKLKKKGITALIFDIDNTLVPFDIPEATREIIDYLDNLQKMGFKICLLSNNKKERVDEFNRILGLSAVHKAKKPRKKGIEQALKLLDAKETETAIIGDQIFTDVWGGNRKGLVTILVKPVSTRDEFTVVLKRGVERLVIKSFVRHAKK